MCVCRGAVYGVESEERKKKVEKIQCRREKVNRFVSLLRFLLKYSNFFRGSLV